MTEVPLTTLATVQPVDFEPAGWTRLASGPPESYVGPLPVSGLTPLATILHSSDWHVCDAESPARQEYMDRYFDPDSPLQAVLGYIGTYRAHEAFTLQVAAAMLESLNSIEAGPVLGRPVDALVITGDVTDNAQLNELQWYLDLLDGRTVDPSGGRPTSEWVGAAQGDERDDRYWHPEGGAPDYPRASFGFPVIPGLIDAARRSFDSPGSRHPWLTVHGNHDALLQGTVAPDAGLEALAVGDRRVSALAAGQSPLDIAGAVPMVGPAGYIHRDDAPTELVTADARRSLSAPGRFAALHLESTTSPQGHGFTAANVADGTAYYVRKLGELLLVAVDTVNPHGGYEGSIDEVQLAWIVEQIAANPGSRVVIASHHPSRAMINDYAPAGEGRRVLGAELLQTLLGLPNVVAWLNGHEHEHQLILNVGPGGRILPEINTASVIDWPQQSRVVEFAVHESGALYVVSTVVDHQGRIEPNLERLDVLDVAGVSRLLAFNDYQRRDPFLSIRRKEGTPADRNFALRLPDPLAL